jgi:hypothetical protein
MGDEWLGNVFIKKVEKNPESPLQGNKKGRWCIMYCNRKPQKGDGKYFRDKVYITLAMVAAISGVVTTAAIGNPFPMPFAIVTMSGMTP